MLQHTYCTNQQNYRRLRFNKKSEWLNKPTIQNATSKLTFARVQITPHNCLFVLYFRTSSLVIIHALSDQLLDAVVAASP